MNIILVKVFNGEGASVMEYSQRIKIEMFEDYETITLLKS